MISPALMNFGKKTYSILPEKKRDTILLRSLAFLKVPWLYKIGTQVVELNEEKCVIKIPLKRLNTNHVGSLYIAVFAAGADIVAGAQAMFHIFNSNKKVIPIFKNLNIEFLKRVEGDALFITTQGKQVGELVKKAIETGERQTMPVTGVVQVPSKLGEETAATFEIGLSVKAY